MKVIPTKQAAWGPTNKPKVQNPVNTTLDCPVYYVGDNGPVLSTSPIFCTQTYAAVVLSVMETWAKKYGFALCHVGVYNPRMARHKDGTEILVNGKPRWSNHAYAQAMDFKGVISIADHKFYDIEAMHDGLPAKLKELLDAIAAAITKYGLKAELVDEGGWFHIGIWHQ